MSFAPALRPEVQLTPLEEGGARLYDPVTDREIKLAAAAAAFVARFDGVTPLADLIEELAGAGHGRERMQRTARTPQLLLFLRDSGDFVRDRLGAIARGELQLPHTVLPEARFECQGSGECCQNYIFGPLADEDITRLEGLDLAGAFPALGDKPFWEEKENENGRKNRYLVSVDDRCIFLLPDHKCGIHARFGPELKPGLCRMYPLEQIATVEGVRLYDKGSCATFARSARSGVPLAEQLPRLIPVLSPAHTLYHPIIRLTDTIPLDYGYWMAFTEAAMNLVARQLGSASSTVVAIGHGLTRFTEALAAYPLGPGEPDATVVAFLRQDAAAWYDAPAAPGGAVPLRDLLGHLLDVIGAVIRHRIEPPQGKPWSARLLREVAAVVHLAQAAAARLADPALAETDYLAEVAAVPVDPAEAAQVDEGLRVSLRQQLFSVRSLVGLSAPAGVLRLALIQLLAVFGARQRAAGDGRAAFVADDLSHAHMLAVRMLELHGSEKLLVQYGQCLPEILGVLPSLVP